VPIFEENKIILLMKLFLSFVLCLVIGNAFSQDIKQFYRENYNKLFPNNKTIQLEKLTHQKDSLKNLSDSLKNEQTVALEKINSLKRDLIELKTELRAEQEKVKTASTNNTSEVLILKDSIAKLTYPLVQVREELITKKGVQDPTLLNTFHWRMYQLVETGTPDYKGRYSWTTEIFQHIGDSSVKITNADLFKKEKIEPLEKMINDRLEEDFNALKISDAECFKSRRYYKAVKLQDMRISLSDHSEITFEIDHGLSVACFAVNASSTTFKIEDLKAFFVE
jgi:hypothetical protein